MKPLTYDRAIVGCCTLDPEAVQTWLATTRDISDPVAELLTTEQARVTMREILKLTEQGVCVDYVTLCERLCVGKGDSALVTPEWLVGTEQAVYAPSHVGHYIAQLIDRRRAVKAALTVQDCAEVMIHQSGSELDEELATTATNLTNLVRKGEHYSTPTPESVIETLEEIEAPTESEAIRWAWSAVQRLTGGARLGQVAIAAAPPGTGKTALALEQAFFTVTALGRSVLAFLAESDRKQVFQRYCMIRHCFDGRKFNTREFTDPDRGLLAACAREFAALEGKLFCWYQQALDGKGIALAVRGWIQKHGRQPGLVIIDHLNRLKSPNSKWGSHEHSAIHANMADIWEMAITERVAVLLLVQPTKESYGSGLHRGRPTLGSLKGSGSPGESAKVVMFTHSKEEDMLSAAVCIPREIVIVKANDGQTGIVDCVFVKPWCRSIQKRDLPDFHSELAQLEGAPE